MTSRAERLLLAENREGISFAVAGYLRYKCDPVGIERAHNIVAQFRNYRAHFIFQRGGFFGGSVFEVNCDRHGFAYLEVKLTPPLCGGRGSVRRPAAYRRGSAY